ncbi:MAG: AAA family ATPase [Bifidobacteriaceae bacterium]|nr:AAA family ATPase [Bifidobacteriaceae bacterium]
MRLARLRIHNHSRLVRDIDIEVRRHLVLVGPNDSGKSSIMRCLDLLLGAAPEELPLRIGIDDLRDRNEEFRVDCEFSSLTPDERRQFADVTFKDARCDDGPVFALSLRVDPPQGVAGGGNSSNAGIGSASGSAGTTGTVGAVGTMDAVDPADAAVRITRSFVVRDIFGRREVGPVDDARLAAIGWRFASSQRRHTLSQPTADEEIIMRLRRLHGLGMPGDLYLNSAVSAIALSRQESRSISQAYSGVDARLEQSEELGAVRAKLAEQLAQIFPQPVTESDVEFVYSGLPRNPRNPMEGVMLRVNVGGDRRTERSEVMGSIAQFVLAAQGAGILAVDEPELHLHPSSQRSLARMLERGGAQCVISTHSADIVSAFDPDCVVTMRAGVAKQLRRGSLDDDARVRMRLWTHDRLEPLTARRIILVEGITDRLIVERVAQVTGRDLDRLGVSLVQTDGVGKMIPFDKVFGAEGFDVPIYRLIDSDAAQDAAERMHVPVEDLERRHVFVSERDLEDEYVRGLGPATVWKALREHGLVALSVLKAWRLQWRAQARAAQDRAEAEALAETQAGSQMETQAETQTERREAGATAYPTGESRDGATGKSIDESAAPTFDPDVFADSTGEEPADSGTDADAEGHVVADADAVDALPTAAQVAEFCRSSNNKVPSALSVLDCITPQSATRITSIARLLDAATGQKA